MIVGLNDGGIDMKAKELMIGDWIQLDGHLDYDKVREIAFDDSMQMYISIACSATLFRAYKFSPIPLTAEILEKNGWRRCGFEGHKFVCPSCTFWLFASCKFTCWEITQTKYDADDNEIDCVLCEIHYVHELQHALRLCGMSELADNFKV